MRSFGSSPRGRGTGTRLKPNAPVVRVIPAWAGNSVVRNQKKQSCAGHPRVGGEQDGPRSYSEDSAGSSPRGRGTGIIRTFNLCNDRVIPAWAGNRTLRLWPLGCTAGHPRVGGEQSAQQVGIGVLAGSSPRGRGTDIGSEVCFCSYRVIPAWAGNRVERRPVCAGIAGHPRVGGEQLSLATVPFGRYGSSPRGRGTEAQQRAQPGYNRVIPAWAGNSFMPSSLNDDYTGHPRVGGEQCRRT